MWTSHCPLFRRVRSSSASSRGANCDRRFDLVAALNPKKREEKWIMVTP
jgi:hypothetical protein